MTSGFNLTNFIYLANRAQLFYPGEETSPTRLRLQMVLLSYYAVGSRKYSNNTSLRGYHFPLDKN